jgi:hypothetical protein
MLWRKQGEHDTEQEENEEYTQGTESDKIIENAHFRL